MHPACRRVGTWAGASTAADAPTTLASMCEGGSSASDDMVVTTVSGGEVRRHIAVTAQHTLRRDRHYADDGLIVFMGDPTQSPDADPAPIDNDTDDAEPVRHTLVASTVAGLCVALWVLVVLVPLSAYLPESTTRVGAAVIVGALLTALLSFCDTFVGPCTVSGIGFDSFRIDCTPMPTMADQLRLCLRTARGNTFGVVLGATAVAVVIQGTTVITGSAATSQLTNAAISLAHATAAHHPLCALLSSVTAGFLFAAMSCSTRGSLIRFVPVFCTAVAVVLFDLRLGLVDTTHTSAVLTLNALKPLASPPAPSILLNGPLAIIGNIAGAVLARVVAELLTPVIHTNSVYRGVAAA